MKTTTVSTAPFLYNYKIWDTKENEYVYTCTHRKDVYRIHILFFNEWVYKEVSVWHSRRFYYDTAAPKTRLERDYRRYTILNHFGKEVPFNDLHEVYRTPYQCDGGDDGTSHKKPDVRYKQGNPNKIKRGYHNGHWWDEEDHQYEYEFVTGGWYRSFNTMQERRRNAADVADWGAEIVRGRRRGRNLPDAWDDYQNATCHSVNSWKTHSKRRHQWKPNS